MHIKKIKMFDSNEQDMHDVKSKTLLSIIYLLAFISFALNGENVIIGLLLGGCLLFQVVFTNDLVYSIPIILIGNDSLGTVFLGKIAFGWFTLALVIVDRFIKKNRFITKSGLANMVYLFLYTCFLIFVQDTYHSVIVKTVIYLILVLYIVEHDKKYKVDWDYFFMWFAIGCFLTALHLMMFGGIAYAESSGELTSMRYGIVGTGTGDPNYGGLRLVTGIVALMSCRRLRILKIPMLIVFLYAIVNTISVTTVMALLVVVVCGVLSENNISKKLKYIICTITGVFFLLYFISIIPPEYLPSGLEVMLYRINEKLNLFNVGNYAQATTGRSDLASMQLYLALKRSTFNFLFGMDSTPFGGYSVLSHNTFVDLIIHFGIVGFVIFIIKAFKNITRTYTSLKKNSNSSDKSLFMLKILYIFFSFGLSIDVDSTFALWVLFLILL